MASTNVTKTNVVNFPRLELQQVIQQQQPPVQKRTPRNRLKLDHDLVQLCANGYLARYTDIQGTVRYRPLRLQPQVQS